MIMTSLLRRAAALVSAAYFCSMILHAAETEQVQSSVEGKIIIRNYLLDPEVPANFGKPFVNVTTLGKGKSNQSGFQGGFTMTTEYSARLAMVGTQITIIAEGTWIAISKRGDASYGTFVLQRALGSQDYTIESVITGGTGRFENVTGSYHSVGSIDADEVNFSYDSEGLVSKIRPSKKDRSDDDSEED